MCVQLTDKLLLLVLSRYADIVDLPVGPFEANFTGGDGTEHVFRCHMCESKLPQAVVAPVSRKLHEVGIPCVHRNRGA